MIERFLRPPSGTAEWLADALRVVGLLSVFVAGFVWSPTDAGILAFTLPALVLPRFLGVRAGFDILFSVSVLVAAWSNVIDLYRTVPGWDLLVHFECTGVLAVMLYVFAGRLRIIPDVVGTRPPARTPIVLATVIGLAISALWEMVEWAGYTFITDEIFVEYADTIGDMAAGGLGALVGGLIATRVQLLE